MKKGWQISCHILIWLGFIVFFASLARFSGKMSVQAVLVVFVLYGFINISLFYLNYLVLIPRFLDKKKYKLYALSILAALVGFGLLKYGCGLIFKREILMHTKGTQETAFLKYFTNTVIISTIFLFLSAVLKFTVDWFLNERVQRDLENQRLSAELSFLKSQINPHFLFNSLNSIYSLAYQKSDTTPEAILKLSEIMRYMLYECNDNKVDLDKELQYLQNYIDLQKIRFGNHAFINFEVNGAVTNQQIVPLLLISFIENAFKHGIANDAAAPITMRINVDDGHLSFFIRNKKHTHNRDASGGIGLANVRRRLNLLYPGKYNLDIRDEADTYTCQLSLVL
ncbi:sensor histidine kinase [Mucilaginibacter phyllosphaerae]|uniref:Histidine kinase n=1 Tax=Mucilaginibacter phyllosphaerae TaxID=1812349 RepID=A0A4Y8A5S1_9SPHI|nr:histidine kinase [Mucilaginibacter phyllosphaerae]MBB3971019.1 LytS/YehU family sensor histidine kinase [Mucilaginibacter phyllosphaerae]TEW63762.1 histidine kinase [Mucilaginibacter phyllosphaerae]GGH21992.1 sensor histidine kinase [Mucilaginibacter phyllosphaerae]